MSNESTTNLNKTIDELSAQLLNIQDGNYPQPKGGFDTVVQVQARLIRSTLPLYSETIKSLDRGSKALVNATWALVAATIVIAIATIALVCVAK